MLIEPIECLSNFNHDNKILYDYQQRHSDEYLHMIASKDPNNYLDAPLGRIFINGKEYYQKKMYLYHKKDHIYLLTQHEFVLIDYLDKFIGIPYQRIRYEFSFGGQINWIL